MRTQEGRTMKNKLNINKHFLINLFINLLNKQSMRKFIFSLKSLAMTLALVVGGSAWAQIASLPFVADFSSGDVAPFTGGSAAFVATIDDGVGDTKVIAANNGESYAQFATPYAISNGEEVTVSFQMLNGWLGGGKDNKFAILNSDGVALASISYNNNSCNINEVLIDNSMVDDFAAFNGQSSAGAKGANGYGNGKAQGFKINTAETKYNAEVTIKINSSGDISVGIVGGKNNNNVTYKRAAQPGTKLDLDKVVISNASNNGDRATGYYGLTITSIKEEVLVQQSFDDATNPTMYPDGSNSNRGTCNYDYVSPIDGTKFLNVWGENNSNGFKVDSIVKTDITASDKQWTLEFDWAGYSGCNGKAGQTKLVDLAGNTFFSIDDAAGWGATFSLSTGQTVACYPCNKATRISANTGSVLTGDDGIQYWHHFTIIGATNGVTVTVEQYSKVGDEIQKTIVVKNAKASATNATPAAIGLRPGSCGSVAINNLKLTVGPVKIVTHDYTVKFVDQNGDAVKIDEVRNAVDGEVLAVTDADKATIIEGKTQYTYVSDDADDRVIDADDMVLTITYNKTTVTDYTVNFLDAESNPIKDAVTHKNVVVGTEVSATSGETSMLLIDGTFFEYKSGNDPITLVEDAEANVINLVFAPVDGVTGYFFNNYENRAVDWTTATGGRYDPVVVDGSTIADRATTEKKPKTDPETGEPIVNPETGEPEYEDVPGLSIPFANKTYFLTVNQANRNNNGVTNGVSSASLAVEQADFTLETQILLGTSNDQGCSFQIKNFAGDANILQLIPTAVGSTTWVVNGDAENFAVELPGTGNFGGTDNNNLTNYNWYDLKVTVYNGTTFVTIVDQNDNVILDKAQVPTLATTYGVGKMIFYTGRYNSNIAVDDVTVRSVVESEDVPAGAEFVAVKINYVDDAGTPVKPADEVKFQVGQPIVLNSAFTADFKVDAEGNVWTAESESAPVTKYIYESDNSADVEVALDAQVNIVFRGVAPRRVALRPQYQTVEGEITTKDASGKNLSFFYDSNKAGDVLFEKDILTVYYPYYLLVDGLLYKTAANSGGTDKIELEIEPGTGTQAKSPVTWTPAMETVPVIDPETQEPALDPETQEPITQEVQISNAVFAQETENIEGITPVKDTYTKIRQANGAAGSAIGGDVLVTILEPGTYTITTATRSGTTNFKAAGNVVATITSGGAVATTTSEEFTVDQATPLYIEEQASTTQYSDYVLVRKTKALESYKIAVAEGIVGGTIEVASSAAEGAEITITATPDEDYELSSISVTCAHKDLAVIVTDGKFTMPDDDVTVNATFRKVVYLETDLTADFISLTSPTTWKSENAAGVGEAKWAAPQVTVAGNKYYMIENYVEGQDVKLATGGVMYNEITGLTPGLYTIELYGSAALTAGRGGMTTDFAEGDEASLHAVTLYAEANGEKVSKYIPCLIESNFNNRGGEESIPTATLDNVVVGNDGKIKIGLYKEVGLTNWHIVQLKKVTAKILASDLLAKAVADAKNVLESQVPAKLYGEIQEAISTYDKDYDTADDYQTAINALNGLVDVAKGYEPLSSVLNEGAQYKANAPAEDPAIATYDAAIADVKAAYDDVVVADIPAAIAVVEAALPALAKAQTAPNSDMTRAIVNPTIDGATGWTTEKPKGGNGPLLNGTAFEYWAGSANPREEAQFDYYQVITGLPTGKYVISAEMYNSLNGEAGAEFAATSGVYGASGNDETATLVDVDGTTLTRYATEEVIVMDGTLRLGVKNTELPMAARWFVADNFTLTLVEHIVPTYAITVVPSENGSLDLPAQAAAGETVAIVANPAVGYELASVMITGVNTNIAVEVDVDEWTGEMSFTMPEDDVTVTATFQEAYVKLSDYAVTVDPAFVHDPEFGDEIVATITYNSEIVGSYAESFALNAQFDYEVKDAEGNVVTTGTKNPLNVSDNTVTAYIDGLAENTTYTINITGVEVTDFDLATFESVVVFKDVIGLDGEPLATATFTTVKPFIAELNVERYVGQGYGVTEAEVDFSEAKTFLGVDKITTDMLRIVNPDGTTISDYAQYDGWFDGDGKAETWGANTKINVKFFEALTDGKYTICDMNGADVVDATYTVRWAIEANDKVAFFNINVKFVEQPTIAPEIATEVDVPVLLKSGTAYEGATAAFNVLDVTGPLNLDAISDAEQYIVNVTDGSFVVNSTDGWRDANGDAATWGTGEGMVCVKIGDPASGIIDYLGAIDDSYEDGDTYTAKWGFVNKESNTAVILNINITFVTDPTGIDATPAADGVKPDGKYFENGKIVIYKNGNKYDASGAPMNK